MPDLTFFYLFAQVTIATVGFMAIVATLQKSSGEKLTTFQFLLFRMFVEVGLIHVSLALTAVALAKVVSAPEVFWEVLVRLFLITNIIYIPYYFVRRIALKAPMPLSSWIVMIGYCLCIPALIATYFGAAPWTDQIATYAYLVWVYASFVIFFTAFVGTFLHTEGQD